MSNHTRGLSAATTLPAANQQDDKQPAFTGHCNNSIRGHRYGLSGEVMPNPYTGKSMPVLTRDSIRRSLIKSIGDRERWLNGTAGGFMSPAARMARHMQQGALVADKEQLAELEAEMANVKGGVL